jgi:hypothetical protein
VTHLKLRQGALSSNISEFLWQEHLIHPKLGNQVILNS